jgi:hypothetical protein
MGRYLNNWTDFVDMVGDFFDVYLTNEEYQAETSPWKNSQFWQDNKAKMDKALAYPELQDIEVLLASYGTANYSGDAFVLYRKGGKLYEVHGSHCSCYGLEGQWGPEETTIESLRHRLSEGRLGSDDYSDNVFKDELAEVLDQLESEAL